MAETHNTEKRGLQCLQSWLTEHGRSFQTSDRKTFDLIVDGQYAELKTKRYGYDKFDFFYMSENQFKAIAEGPTYLLFLVCNVDDPENVEIFEISSQELSTIKPKREIKYYWDKGLVEQLLNQRT